MNAISQYTCLCILTMQLSSTFFSSQARTPAIKSTRPSSLMMCASSSFSSRRSKPYISRFRIGQTQTFNKPQYWKPALDNRNLPEDGTREDPLKFIDSSRCNSKRVQCREIHVFLIFSFSTTPTFRTSMWYVRRQLDSEADRED